MKDLIFILLLIGSCFLPSPLIAIPYANLIGQLAIATGFVYFGVKFARA